jgi:uncharacterized protein DUF5317
MVLALPVLAALVVGVALGGRLSNLAHLRLRASWLFFAAIGLQIVAFPFVFLPWRTDELVATVLWLASYALLIGAAVLNHRITGVPLVALGMGMNVVAIAANGGTMPVLPEAMHGAGGSHATLNNSTAVADPSFAWLVDRWAAPDWIPFANVFSVGDVLIAAGAAVIVLAALGVRLPRPVVDEEPSRKSGIP